MTYDRLIHEYLDEGLSEPMQEQLFGQLSSNAELRNEFNKQMKLHLLAKDDFEDFAPPTELTNRVFTTAGFSAPFASLPGFKVSYLFGLLPILLILFTFTDVNENAHNNLANNSEQIQDKSQTQNNKIAVSTIGSSIIEDVSNSKSSNLEATNSNNISNNSGNNLDNNSANKSNFIAGNSNNKRNNSISENNRNGKVTSDSDKKEITYLYERNMDFEGRPAFIISSSKLKESLVSITKINQPVININSPSVDNSFVLNTGNNSIDDDNTSMALIAKGINNSSLYQNISNYNLPIANYALALVYKFENNWAILAEFSNENYFQEFQNVNSDGINYTTRQNPSLMIISAGLKYTAKDLFNSNLIYPYVQLNAGYTSIGIVSKLVAGLEYRISDKISLMPSYEFSNLAYSNQLGNYFAFNNGFSLGLTYNFNERK